MHAASNGQLGAVDILLKHGADPNLTEDSSQTALMKAASNLDAGVVERLLKAKR
jgi:ankyrin repeat protein